MKITKEEMSRRMRINKATSAITEAMMAVTKEYGEMTTAEWLKVLNDAVGRLIAYELQTEIRSPTE